MAVDQEIEPHWRDKGRAAGISMSLFTIYRCRHDPKTHGKLSFGRLIDFLTEDTKDFRPEEGAGEEQDAISRMLAQ
jgi:hypothetical protein